MGKIVIDERGVVEESGGRGVIADINIVATCEAGGMMLCRTEPDSVPPGVVAVWREGDTLTCKDPKGALYKMAPLVQELPAAKPQAIKKIAPKKSPAVKKPPPLPSPPKRAAAKKAVTKKASKKTTKKSTDE